MRFVHTPVFVQHFYLNPNTSHFFCQFLQLSFYHFPQLCYFRTLHSAFLRIEYLLSEVVYLNEYKLLHLHPTLAMLASELEVLGISCQQEGTELAQSFRGVSLFTGRELIPGLLYILKPEDAPRFPVDQQSYLCTQPVPGDAPHLFCPGLEESVLLSTLLELFAQWQAWEQQIDQLIYHNGALHELCQFGEAMLENPICIHDDWFIMIAMSQDLPKVLPPDYIMTSSKKFIPQAIVEDFKFDTEYLETYQYRTAQYWASSPNTPACLYVNLWDGEVYQGRLLTVSYRRDFRPMDYLLTEFLTQRASLLMQRRRLGHSQSYRSLDDILYDLLQGKKPDPAEETQLLTMLNWNRNDKFTCIRVQGQQESTLVTGHALHSDLFRAFPGSYILFDGHQQCVVLNLSQQTTTLPRIRHALAPLCRDYCLYAGISSPVPGTQELSLAFHQAEVALNQAFRLQNEKWIIPFSDCALDYILSSLQTPLEPRHITSPELRLLMDLDREKGTQYFETLRTYLLQERDIPKTSEALIIHRTTLQYRLKKIHSLTELDLNDPWQRLYLLLSLWILERES